MELTTQLAQTINWFQHNGFPAAHPYGDERRPSGVAKIIEGGVYDIQIDFGQSNGGSNKDGGIAVCLFVKRNPNLFNYRNYFDKKIPAVQAITTSCVINHGKNEYTGVIAKCWIRGVDWRRDEFRIFQSPLVSLFNTFHATLSELVTVDDVRDRFLFWAMDQRLMDGRGETSAWTKVKNQVNEELVLKLDESVGGLATVANLDYLGLEKFLEDSASMLYRAVSEWQNQCAELAFQEDDAVHSTDPYEIKRSIVRNSYVKLFKMYFKERHNYHCDEKVAVQEEISRMHATEYLINMLSRSQNGKKFENYVVTGLWSRLCASYHRYLKKVENEIKICPRIVTQQLVRRAGGHRALIDLYFPEIKLAIECDEAQHKKNIAEDALRERDIFESGLIEKASDLQRIDATCSYSDMDNRLDSIFEEIKKRVNAKDRIFGLRAPIDIAHGNDRLSDDDGLLYQSKTEALAALGMRQWKNGPACSRAPLCAYFDSSGNAWRVAFLEIEKTTKKGIGWEWYQNTTAKINIVNPNERCLKSIENCSPDEQLIVFVAQPDNLGYAFVGVYKKEGDHLSFVSNEAPLFCSVFD